MRSIPLRLTQFVALLLCLTHRSASALPERVLSFDVGLGIPELLFLHGQVQAARRWQFGVGYSYIPAAGVLGKSMDLPSTTLTLADGISYATTPTLVPKLSYLSAFVRFFPAENNFYFQFTYSRAQLTATVSSGLENTILSEFLVGALVSADVVFKQAIPTVSIGYLFMGKFFFANFSLGVSWISTLTSAVTINAVIPDALGGTAGNQAALDQFQTNLQNQGNTAASSLRTRFPVFPSLTISFGFQL